MQMEVFIGIFTNKHSLDTGIIWRSMILDSADTLEGQAQLPVREPRSHNKTLERGEKRNTDNGKKAK